MIYSKFGTSLKLVSKHQGGDAPLAVQASAGDSPDLREYYVADLKADGGTAEIAEAVAKLPFKAIGKKARVPQPLRF